MSRHARPLSSYGPKLIDLLIKASQTPAATPIIIKDRMGVIKRLQNELYALRRAMQTANDPRFLSVSPVTMSLAGKHHAKKDEIVELHIFRASTEYDTIIDAALSAAPPPDPTLLSVPLTAPVTLEADPLADYEPEGAVVAVAASEKEPDKDAQ